jgi:hypothetical protein
VQWKMGLPLTAVLAVVFGSTPASAGSALPGPQRALAALRALESATSGGLGYGDYHVRFVDATVAIDAAGREGGGSHEFWRAVTAVLDYYGSARRSWSIAVELGDGVLPDGAAERLLEEWRSDDCPALRALGAWPGRIDATRLTKVVVPTEWSCAAEKLAEADRLAR